MLVLVLVQMQEQILAHFWNRIHYNFESSSCCYSFYLFQPAIQLISFSPLQHRQNAKFRFHWGHFQQQIPMAQARLLSRETLQKRAFSYSIYQQSQSCGHDAM
jgi:hypothetical protein